MSAVSDYFRTALLIDDRVAPDYQPLETPDINEPAASGDEPESGLVPPPAEDETPVYPSSLVAAFLEESVVCSVVEAREDGPDPVQMALKGAQIADLLILDWLLFGSSARTVEAIRKVAEQNKSRLRVVVVYTGAHSLGDVAERLVQEAGFARADDFVLKRGCTVVLVFGKPGPPLTGGENRRQPSTIGELPTMIRKDLEMVFKGLMPESAFRGIDALRESAPRILATFNSELDTAALVHRALLSEPADFGAQFVRLLASDFEQVLQNERIGEVWDGQSVRTYIEGNALAGSPARLAGILGSNQDVRDDVKALGRVEMAREAIINGLSEIGLGDSAVKRAVPALVAAVGDGVANEALAVLMSSSSLGETSPRLELGIIVQDEDKGLWLCIQALCDSVRLEKERAFPMLRITIAPTRPAAMIRLPDGEAIPIGFDTSPYRLTMPTFAPTDGGSVMASGDPSSWHFTSEDGAHFRAVTRLRPEIAAQAVHGVASAASRVGTDISEWLRRGAPDALAASSDTGS